MREKDFQNLLESIKQAGEIKKGKRKPSRIFHFDRLEIRKIRKKFDQSQSEFAHMIGISVATLRNWEQGRRTPDGPALALLKVAAAKPEAVVEALHQ